MKIRSADATDANSVLEIYSHYVEDTAITFECETPTLDEFAGRMTTTLQRYPYVVVEDGGRDEGYAYAGPLKERAAYDRSCEVSIAGTEGWAKRLEAIEIRLVAKGSSAPGSTAGAFKKLNNGDVHTEYFKKLSELKREGRTLGDYAFMDLTGDGIDEMIVSWWPSIYSFRGGSVVLVENKAVMGSCSYGGAYLKKKIVLGLTPDHMGSSSQDYLVWNGVEFVNMASIYDPSAAARRNGYLPYYWIKDRGEVSKDEVQQYISNLIGNDTITRITYQRM